jgi:hypothetical protein
LTPKDKDWTVETACVVVKTYPVPAWNGVEVSCTAAISERGHWLRLFPVPFRYLAEEQRFAKYHWIRVRVRRSADFRPESYNIDPDSIELLSNRPIPTDDKWKQRKDLVFPLLSRSMCSLQIQQRANGHPTLGIFKPKTIDRLVIEEGAAEWTLDEEAKLDQTDLFHKQPAIKLQKIPYKFSYEYTCNAEGCTGHRMMCSDWEMAQAYRAWRQKYGNNWEKPFREKFEAGMRERFDTHFYVGTVHQHPDAWIIVGLFYPMP